MTKAAVEKRGREGGKAAAFGCAVLQAPSLFSLSSSPPPLPFSKSPVKEEKLFRAASERASGATAVFFFNAVIII